MKWPGYVYKCLTTSVAWWFDFKGSCSSRRRLYLGETSLQLEKELRNFFGKYLKELTHLSLIHETYTFGNHFKYKDKQAHLERSNVVYKLKCSCGHSYIGQTLRNWKFRLDEHSPLKSNHQATDVVKHLYTYPGHFMDFKNPEIFAYALNYR